jgi:hypothetical protein
VLESQRQLKKVGLNQALIRVFRTKGEKSEYPEHNLEIDPRINALDIEKICKICPMNILEVSEEEDTDAGLNR